MPHLREAAELALQLVTLAPQVERAGVLRQAEDGQKAETAGDVFAGRWARRWIGERVNETEAALDERPSPEVRQLQRAKEQFLRGGRDAHQHHARRALFVGQQFLAHLAEGIRAQFVQRFFFRARVRLIMQITWQIGKAAIERVGGVEFHLVVGQKAAFGVAQHPAPRRVTAIVFDFEAELRGHQVPSRSCRP